MLENSVIKPEILLATVTDLPSDLQGDLQSDFENELSELLDKFNPHGVIIEGYSADLAFAVRALKPDFKKFKILFLTDVSLENAELIDNLYSKAIYIADKIDLQNIPKPLDIKTQLDELKRKKEELEQQEQEELLALFNAGENNSENAEVIDLMFDENTLENDTFTAENITVINEPTVETDYSKSGSAVIVGVSGLQHHIGSTHTSFEIAEFLRQQCCNPCVVFADNATYGALADFHNVPFAKSKNAQNSNGNFEINKISVYPQNMLETAKKRHEYVVYDLGFSENFSALESADIKIMLCSSADWDLRIAMTFLNSASLSFKKEISYFFYPITKSKFIRLNRQFIKTGCKAFRLAYSPDCREPHKENKEVYAALLRLKNNDNSRKNKKTFGLF
jgi:hypothetical protein